MPGATAALELVSPVKCSTVACANAAFWFQCSTFVACTIRLAVLVGWGAWRQFSVRSVACTVRFRGAIPAHRVPQHSVPMQVCGSALGRMAAVPRVAIRWRAQGKVCVGPESAAFGFHWRAQRKVCVGLGSAALTRVTVPDRGPLFVLKKCQTSL